MSVDRNLLRLAVYEMLFSAHISPKGAINEAVDMAKVYGKQESASFVLFLSFPQSPPPFPGDQRKSPAHKYSLLLLLSLSSSVLYLLPYSAFPAPAEVFSPHIPH